MNNPTRIAFAVSLSTTAVCIGFIAAAEKIKRELEKNTQHLK